MGCDIHCYIEYKPKGRDDWRDFGGRINPGRNYLLFGAMAGVRVEDAAHLEPRGRLSDTAHAAWSDDRVFVYADAGDDSVTPEDAAEQVAKGWAQYAGREGHEQSFITCSDYHSHSWLTADEFELALAVYLKESGFAIGSLKLPAPAEMSALTTVSETQQAKWALDAITEYWAILHAMRCFEAQGCESRLVFWFDN